MLQIMVSGIFALVSFGYLSAVLMVLLKHDRKPAPVRVKSRRF